MRNETIVMQIKAAIESNMHELNKLACNTVISMWQFNDKVRTTIFTEYFLEKSIQLIKKHFSPSIKNHKQTDTMIKEELLRIFKPLRNKEISDEIAEHFLSEILVALDLPNGFRIGQMTKFLVITDHVLETIYGVTRKVPHLEISIKNTYNHINSHSPNEKFLYPQGSSTSLVRELKFVHFIASKIILIPAFLGFFMLAIFLFNLSTKQAFIIALALTSALNFANGKSFSYDSYREFILSTKLRDILVSEEQVKKPLELLPKKSANRNLAAVNDASSITFSADDEKDPYRVDSEYKRKIHEQAPSASYIACLSQVVKNTAPKTVVWEYNQATVNFPGDAHTIIPLWTANPGQKSWNNKYFILWDHACGILQQFDQPLQEKAINKAVLGKISKAEEEEGWVECTKEMAGELQQRKLSSKTKAFKLKLLGTKGGQHRIVFFSIAESRNTAQEEKKTLFGNPILKTH